MLRYWSLIRDAIFVIFIEAARSSNFRRMILPKFCGDTGPLGVVVSKYGDLLYQVFFVRIEPSGYGRHQIWGWNMGKKYREYYSTTRHRMIRRVPVTTCRIPLAKCITDSVPAGLEYSTFWRITFSSTSLFSASTMEIVVSKYGNGTWKGRLVLRILLGQKTLAYA
jgi:hypothetical protein